jgi:hypothetical protein
MTLISTFRATGLNFFNFSLIFIRKSKFYGARFKLKSIYITAIPVRTADYEISFFQLAKKVI